MDSRRQRVEIRVKMVRKGKVKTKKTAHKTSSNRTRCLAKTCQLMTPNKKALQTRQPKMRIMPMPSKSSHRWPRCQVKADKDRDRPRLNLWSKYPLTMNLLQPLRPKTNNLSRNKTRLTKIQSKGRSNRSLPRCQHRQQQRRKTLNKNKLNKIIKLRIEFKFERVAELA